MPKYEFAIVRWEGGFNLPGQWVFHRFGDQSPTPTDVTSGDGEDVVADFGEQGWMLFQVHDPEHAMDNHRYYMQRAIAAPRGLIDV